MNRIIMIIAAFLIAFSGYSQEPSKEDQRRLMNELKKEQEAEDASRKAEIVGWMVEKQRFVLEADRLRDKYGNTSIVSSMINFLAADSLYGVIQIGSDRYVGLNGVGGITVDGRITNYKYERNQKNNTFSVSFHLNTATAHYDVHMVVFPDGRAQATVTSNWPGQLNYLGYLVPPVSSRVFKGTTLY